MASKKSRKANQQFAALRYVITHPVGALGSVTVGGVRVLGSDLEEDLFVSSVDIAVTMKDYTPTASDGPIVCGFYHNDYSVTEVKEALEVTLLGPANKIEQERMRRLVRIIGILQPEGVVGTVIGARINDGKKQRVKLNWTIQNGKSLSFFVYNAGSGAMTTGAIVDAVGTVFGRWLL